MIFTPDNARISPVRHPAVEAGCSPAQIRAFDDIASGRRSRPRAAVLDALARAGLIRLIEQHSSTAFGRCAWRVPFIPSDIHAQWRAATR